MLAIINGINDGNLELILPIVLGCIIGIVQAARLIGFPAKYSPILSIVIGIILSVLYLGTNSIKNGILIGIWLGLGSVGLFSGFKNTFFKDKNTNGKDKKTLNFYNLKK